MTAATFGTVRLGVFCHHGCASLLDGPTRSSAFWTRWRLITRTAALIILRTGVRVSESWISNPNQVLVA